LLHGGGFDGLFFGNQFFQLVNQRIDIGQGIGDGGLFAFGWNDARNLFKRSLV